MKIERSSHRVSLLAILLAGCATASQAEVEAPRPGQEESVESGPVSPPVTDPGTDARQQDGNDVAPAFDQTHARWTKVLKANVKGPLFDYAAVAKDPSELKAYLAELESVTPEALAGWTREQRYAYWINAYNAYTIQLIVDNLPLKSIRDLSGSFGLSSVFDKAWIPLEPHHPKGKKKKLSLNDIEHEILRPRFEDARVHAAVNCASWSCPPLLGEAFVAARLEKQLDAQMRAFVADRDRNVFDRGKKVARISKIFDWFRSDFDRDAGSVRAYLLKYASEEDAAFLRDAKLRHVDYDWKLNAVEKDS